MTQSARSTTTDAPISAIFNPLAPDQIEDPYTMFAQARREEPVFYSPVFGSWVVSRYDDIMTVAKQPELFSSARPISPGVLPDEVRAILAQGYRKVPSILDTDPPEHTRLRNVISRAFTPQRIAAMEPKIHALAAELIDGFAQDGKVELVSRFASPLPGLVICDLLGVPRSDLDQLKQWSDNFMTLVTMTESLDRLIESAHSYVAFQRYMAGQLQERSRQPREDLLTVLVPEAWGGSAPISIEEAIAMSMGMHVAGQETTAHLIGSALMLLIQHPEQKRMLHERPDLIPNAIEETLRFESPAKGIFRVTTAEVELGDVTIPADARVMVLWASGSRDETAFPDGDRFDLQRPDVTQHFGFGKGVHYCVGAPLARLEGRIALRMLLERLPNVRVQPGATLRHWPRLFIRGYMELPLAWDLHASSSATS